MIRQQMFSVEHHVGAILRAEFDNNTDELRRLIMNSAIDGPQGAGHLYFNIYFRRPYPDNSLIHPQLGDLRELASEIESQNQLPGLNLVAVVIRHNERSAPMIVDDPFSSLNLRQ